MDSLPADLPTAQTGQHPLVSVVIIFFNAKKERFFEEAIESVFAQTYEHWELLLADDGSTDQSSAIAKHYAQQHPGKVHYLEHPNHQNLGMSAARNLGIRAAKGKYVAFLDADDVWLPRKLAQQVALLEAHPEAVMLYGKTQFWFSWHDNNPVPYFSLEEEEEGSKEKVVDPMTLTSVAFDQVIEPPTQLLLYLDNQDIYPCSCSMIMRRYVFEVLGGYEEAFRDANEDMVFHSKLFLRFPVYVSSQCWDRYRIHPDSFWRAAWREGRGQETTLSGRFNYLTWLESYLAEQAINRPEVERALKKAFRPFRQPRLHRFILRYQSYRQKIRRYFRKFTKTK